MHHVLLYGSFPICSCSFAYWILHRLHHELLQNTKMPTRFCHVYLFNRATSMLFHLSVSSSFLHLLSSFLCPLKFQLIWAWALWAFLLFHIIFFLIWLHMTTASLSCQLLHSSTFLLLYIFYAQLFIPDMKITNWIESCEVKTGERERERDLKGSWAVKWRRWWQGEGNLLEDKQKRETQMKMRVERYRKRNEDCSKRTVGSRPQSYNRLWNTVHISCVLFQRHSVRCWAEAVKGEPGPWHFACVDSCLWDNSLLFFCFVILYRSLKEKHSFCLGALRWEARVSARPAAAC